MKTSALVDANRFPSVAQFLEVQVEMQFEDLRVLLQLPVREWKAGCNFATASVLFTLISGFSICLYEAPYNSIKEGKRVRDTGKRFKKMLERYYPWEIEGVAPDQGSGWLYEVARNPLAHSLGIWVTNIPEWAGLAKRPLLPNEIEELETSPVRSHRLPPTLVRVGNFENGQPGTFLSIPTFYWGTWRLLDKLCKDTKQMEGAERLLAQIELVPARNGLITTS